MAVAGRDALSAERAATGAAADKSGIDATKKIRVGVIGCAVHVAKALLGDVAIGAAGAAGLDDGVCSAGPHGALACEG